MKKTRTFLAAAVKCQAGWLPACRCTRHPLLARHAARRTLPSSRTSPRIRDPHAQSRSQRRRGGARHSDARQRPDLSWGERPGVLRARLVRHHTRGLRRPDAPPRRQQRGAPNTVRGGHSVRARQCPAPTERTAIKKLQHPFPDFSENPLWAVTFGAFLAPASLSPGNHVIKTSIQTPSSATGVHYTVQRHRLRE